MTGDKRWFESTTVWGGIASIIAGLAILAGVDFNQAAFVALMTEAGAALAAALGGVTAVIGRFKARRRVGR